MYRDNFQPGYLHLVEYGAEYDFINEHLQQLQEPPTLPFS